MARKPKSIDNGDRPADRDDIIPAPVLRAPDIYGRRADDETVQELSEQVERLSEDMKRLRGNTGAAPRPTYTVAEAAQLLGKSTQTIRRWIREGKLDSTKSANSQQGQHMVPYASIERYLRGS